jgi:hypothetical protein
MPRRRPRVGQSIASDDSWEDPTLLPRVNFTLEFDNNLFDYAYDLDGQRPQLLQLLAAKFDPPPVDGWVGLAQPRLVQCAYRGPVAADPLPTDIVCSYQHSHTRWRRVNERGQGELQGELDGRHRHEFEMRAWVSAQCDENDPSILGWYAPHSH